MSQDYELSCPGCDIIMSLDEEFILASQGNDVECPECECIFELPVIIETEEAEEAPAAPEPAPPSSGARRKQMRATGVAERNRSTRSRSARTGKRSKSKKKDSKNSESGQSRKPAGYVEPAGPPKTSGLAIAALVTSILSIPLAAVICGHMARARIKQSDGQLTGAGLALAGLIIGYLGFVANILLIVAIAIPSFSGARAAAQALSCQNNLVAIQAAKERWVSEKGVPTGAPTDHNGVNAVIGSIPTCPAKGAYKYSPVGKDPVCSLHGAPGAAPPVNITITE